MSDCIFCKLIAGDIPSHKVYENGFAVAFLDAKPVNLGHTLVVPRDHFPDLTATPDDIVAQLFPLAKKVAAAAVQAVGAQGFNTSVNTGKAAGQVVFHTHVHVIPRFDGDGLAHWPKKEVTADDMRRTAEAMRGLL